MVFHDIKLCKKLNLIYSSTNVDRFYNTIEVFVLGYYRMSGIYLECSQSGHILSNKASCRQSSIGSIFSQVSSAPWCILLHVKNSETRIHFITFFNDKRILKHARVSTLYTFRYLFSKVLAIFWRIIIHRVQIA